MLARQWRRGASVAKRNIAVERKFCRDFSSIAWTKTARGQRDCLTPVTLYCATAVADDFKASLHCCRELLATEWNTATGIYARPFLHIFTAQMDVIRLTTACNPRTRESRAPHRARKSRSFGRIIDCQPVKF